MKKQTFALYFGNRGFMPAELIEGARADMIKAVTDAGYDYIAMDNGATASFVGLTLAHSASDLYRALLEGVAYEMLYNLEALSRYGICPERLFATGGGARSAACLEIKADILEKTLIPLEAKEVGAMGTCMLVGRAIGLYKTLAQAKAVFVKQKGEIKSSAEKSALYKTYYEGYHDLYGATRPITKKIYGR